MKPKEVRKIKEKLRLSEAKINTIKSVLYEWACCKRYGTDEETLKYIWGIIYEK